MGGFPIRRIIRRRAVGGARASRTAMAPNVSTCPGYSHPRQQSARLIAPALTRTFKPGTFAQLQVLYADKKVAAPIGQLRTRTGNACELIGEHFLLFVGRVAEDQRTGFAQPPSVGKDDLLALADCLPDVRVDCAGHQRRSTVTLRFSPRFGFSPVSFALANSYMATALLAGPSHNSAVSGRTRNTQTVGSSGPLHHMSSVLF